MPTPSLPRSFSRRYLDSSPGQLDHNQTPLRKLVLGTTLATVSRIYLFTRRGLPALVSAGLFALLFHLAYKHYRRTAGDWTTDDSHGYPWRRTQFVLLLFVLPVWGASMALFTILWNIVFPALNCGRMLWPRRRMLLPRGKLSTDIPDEEYNVPLLQPSSRESEEGAVHGAATLETYEDINDLLTRHAAEPAQGKRWWILSLLFYLSLAACGGYLWKTREYSKDWRFRESIDGAYVIPHPEARRQGRHGERVYIAAMFHENHDVLQFWIPQIQRLCAYIGTDKVYVSILESYSWDESPQLLRALAENLSRMGVRHTIRTHDETIPHTVDTDRRKIRFLSASRNLVMQPLITLAEGGERFDRVLWSNDVFVHAEAMVELLNADNRNYDMACGLDFNYFGLYDQWVLRDRLGGLVSSNYPYFWDQVSLNKVLNEEPAPVFTCWNGVLAVRAEPFLPPRLRLRNDTYLYTSPLAPELVPTHPLYKDHRQTPPFEQPELIFRDSGPDEPCFSSESLLMPYDLRRRFKLEKIVAVPSVISTYSWNQYVWFKYVLRHWIVRWYINKIELGARYAEFKFILGWPESVFLWDGGHCMGESFNTNPRNARQEIGGWRRPSGDL